MEKHSLGKQHRIGVDKTINAIKQNGVLVADNERYTIYDLNVDELTISMTELKPMQETRGHSHMDASEVYFFVDGIGRMRIGEQEYDVKKGSVILVPKGEFHKVSNLDKGKLVFAAVFEGSRSSKKYNYNDK
jgi:mannose-6-phosphate isomerase-like protein (cupin superfamily)